MSNDITRQAFWTIHSPYPDGTWRGLEKCLGETSEDGAPYLFDDPARAQLWIDKSEIPHLTVVRLVLEYPAVRKPLDVVGSADYELDPEPDYADEYKLFQGLGAQSCGALNEGTWAKCSRPNGHGGKHVALNDDLKVAAEWDHGDTGSQHKPWMVDWRMGDWPAGAWTRLEATSEASIIQKARKIYRMHRRSPSGLALRVANWSPDETGPGISRLQSIYNENSPEITQYASVVFGPVQEAYVGTNVPVWRVVGTLQANGNLMKGVSLASAKGLLHPLTMTEIADALAYYAYHKDEIDTQINSRGGA